MPESLAVRASLALVGTELEVRRDVCIWIREGVIESIESTSSCPPNALGGRDRVALPQPANAHIHSGDQAFPEYGVDLPIEEVVAPPRGLKHLLLSKTPTERLVQAIREAYLWAWRSGVGLLADFREGGGEGCKAALRALSGVPRGMEVLVLGRPGPGWPGPCMGVGISSPLDYSPKELSELARTATALGGPLVAHVAEVPEARGAGDLEVALEYGFNAVVHGVHLSQKDLEIIASNGVALIVCPRSNLWHQVGLPPVPAAWDTGVTVGLGTDNAGWFPPDPWIEAEVLAYTALLRGAQRPLLARRILEALFLGGYRALGREPRMVAEGREAHFLVVNAAGRGIIEALDPYWAIIKRVGTEAIWARVDGLEVRLLRSS